MNSLFDFLSLGLPFKPPRTPADKERDKALKKVIGNSANTFIYGLPIFRPKAYDTEDDKQQSNRNFYGEYQDPLFDEILGISNTAKQILYQQTQEILAEVPHTLSPSVIPLTSIPDSANRINNVADSIIIPIPANPVSPPIIDTPPVIDAPPIIDTPPVINTPPDSPPSVPNPDKPNTITGVAQKALATIASIGLKYVLPSIPVIGWILYSSKKKIVTNVDISITAGLARKAYRVTLGKGNSAISVAFEAFSGNPLRFLRETGVEQSSSNKPISIYSSYENTLKKNVLGPFKVFIWKRKEHYALCNIIINEPFNNPSLEKGPRITSIPISNREFIRVIHRRYQLKGNSNIHTLPLNKPYVEDPSGWTSRKLSITIGSSDRTMHVSIPPLEGSKSDEYVCIEQQEIFE